MCHFLKQFFSAVIIHFHDFSIDCLVGLLEQTFVSDYVCHEKISTFATYISSNEFSMSIILFLCSSLCFLFFGENRFNACMMLLPCTPNRLLAKVDIISPFPPMRFDNGLSLFFRRLKSGFDKILFIPFEEKRLEKILELPFEEVCWLELAKFWFELSFENELLPFSLVARWKDWVCALKLSDSG